MNPDTASLLAEVDLDTVIDPDAPARNFVPQEGYGLRGVIDPALTSGLLPRASWRRHDGRPLTDDEAHLLVNASGEDFAHAVAIVRGEGELARLRLSWHDELRNLLAPLMQGTDRTVDEALALLPAAQAERARELYELTRRT
ncbi:hypothetical protein [Euzebya pacifica]|uniref:hypothetical protein n=1 Tax=Euzebya pacifica TaxID=1608957 RepID=UPI0030F63D67